MSIEDGVTPDATPAPVADTQPGTVQEDGQAPETGAEAKVEETPEQRAEREKAEAKKRDERRARKLNERFRELTDTIKAKDALIERIVGAQATQRPQAQETDQQPRREQFGDYDEYIAAHARWVARQEFSQLSRAQQQQQAAAQAQIVENLRRVALTQTHSERVQSFAKSNPDFQEVFDSDVDVGAAGEAIMEMDDGPAVMLYLHRNPSMADKLRNASPRLQGVMLGQISAALKSRAPQVSKAPAPGKPVGGQSAAPSRDLSTADYDDYVKQRRAARSR